jgi:AraC-like DNA-binding protein
VSRKRQTAVFDPLPASNAQILALIRNYRAAQVIPLHFHDRDQLVFATCGVMTVTTNDGAWVVPAHRAVWIPAKTEHTITMSGLVAMRTLYLKPRLAESLPRTCCVVNISDLLKELILHACKSGSLGRRVSWQSHLIDVILDQLRAINVAPLQLTLPEDPRAMRVAEVLMADPADPRRLTQIARVSGASHRTIERLFVDETGMTFGKWRQQLRLMHAMRLLGGGAKVTRAALDAGYGTPSAFIATFRKALGATPARYFNS